MYIVGQGIQSPTQSGANVTVSGVFHTKTNTFTIELIVETHVVLQYVVIFLIPECLIDIFRDVDESMLVGWKEQHVLFQ